MADTLQTDIIVSDIFRRDGQRQKGGAYHLTKWTDQNGIKYSSFEPSARDVTMGSKVRLFYTSGEKGNDVESFEVLSLATAEEAAATAAAGPGNGGKAWERDEALSRTDRLGIEAHKNRMMAYESAAKTITAFVAQLRAADKLPTAEEQAAHDGAIAWITGLFAQPEVAGVPRDAAEAIGRMGGAAPDDSIAKAWDKLEGGGGNGDRPITNVGQLLTWCDKEGVSRTAFMEIVNVTEADLPKIDIAVAHQAVKDYLAAQKA